MMRHPILALTAATALAFMSPAASASAPAEWTQLDRDVAAACLKAAGMAEATVSPAVKAVQGQMRTLDEATERPLATTAFNGSDEAFNEFRKCNCRWLSAQSSPGTGSGDIARDCMIRMTLSRAEELRTQLNAKAGAAQREPRPRTADLEQLTGRPWRLTGLERDGRQVALLPESIPSIQFDEGGRVSGNASINRFSGGYTIEASGALHWSKPGFATTRMAGPPELMEQEAEFVEALDRVVRARVENGTLVLENGEQTIVLRFEH